MLSRPPQQVGEGGKDDAPVVEHAVARLFQHVQRCFFDAVDRKAQAHVGLALVILPGVELHTRQLHLFAVPQNGEIGGVVLRAHQLIEDIVCHKAAAAVHRKDLIPCLQAGLAAEGVFLHLIEDLAGDGFALGCDEDGHDHKAQHKVHPGTRQHDEGPPPDRGPHSEEYQQAFPPRGKSPLCQGLPYQGSCRHRRLRV